MCLQKYLVALDAIVSLRLISALSCSLIKYPATRDRVRDRTHLDRGFQGWDTRAKVDISDYSP